MNKKYPYIADKDLYKATIFACQMIRQNGFFNKAVKIASKHYDVDESKIAKEIRKRQSIGQKEKRIYKKFKWFIVDEFEYYQHRDDGYEYIPDINRFKIMKAYDRNNIETSETTNWGFQNESTIERVRVVIEEFKTKKDAENYLNKIRSKQ